MLIIFGFSKRYPPSLVSFGRASVVREIVTKRRPKNDVFIVDWYHMRRQSLLVIGLGAIAPFFLAACSNAPRPISADELLRRTVVMHQGLETTGFAGTASLFLNSLSGSLTGTGTLERGGESWTWEGDVSLARSAGTSFERLRARIAAAQNQGRKLVFIHEMSGLLGEEIAALAPGASLTGQWIEIGRTDPAPSETRVATPDPDAVERIIGSFQPLGDPRVLPRDDGGYDYSLQVRFSTGANAIGLSGGGTLSIDSDSFVLRRSVWTIDRISLPLGDLRLWMDLTFFALPSSDAEPVTQSGALAIPLESILHTIFSIAPVP